MTPEDLKVQMQALEKDDDQGDREGWQYDPVTGHEKADELLVAALRELGYGEAMDIYEAQTRWYYWGEPGWYSQPPPSPIRTLP